MPDPAPTAMPSPIREDMKLQRRNWRAERIAWFVMAALVGAALAGLFGNGPASHAKTRDPAGLVAVRYDRVLRFTAPAGIVVTLSPEATRSGEAALVLDEEFLRSFRLTGIHPRPEVAIAMSDGLLLRFRTEAGAAAQLRLVISAERIGFIRPGVAIAGQASLRLPAFVHP